VRVCVCVCVCGWVGVGVCVLNLSGPVSSLIRQTIPSYRVQCGTQNLQLIYSVLQCLFPIS